jgi:hypothetical protein
VVALADKVVVLAVSVAIADMAAFSAIVRCNTAINNYTALKLCFIVNESHQRFFDLHRTGANSAVAPKSMTEPAASSTCTTGNFLNFSGQDLEVIM